MHRTVPLLATFLFILSAPAVASAQEPYSPLVPRGKIRLGLRSEYSSFSSGYGIGGAGSEAPGGLEQLSDAFSGPADTRIFPTLARFEDAVGNASGESFTMSLGSMASVMEKSAVRVPVSIDVGVFDWLTVGAVVPLVQSETEFSLHFATDSAGTNAGLSPGVADTDVVSGFLSGLQGSIGAYDAFRNTTCLSDPSSSRCLDATALLADARAFGSALSAMYGSLMAPLGWSPAGMAMQARLATFAEAFLAAGVTGVPATVPLAEAPLGAEELQRLVTDPVFGIAGSYALEQWTPLWRLGDIEVRVDGRLLESGEPEGAYHVVAGAGAVVRLPTGVQDDPANFLDMGTGDAQPDVEVRGWMNGRWRSGLGLWADLRYGVQMSGTTERRVFAPGFTFAPRSTQLQLDWNPGDYQFIELSPWYRLADPLTLLGGYRYFRKGLDTFALGIPEGTEPAPPGTLLNPGILVPGSDVSSSQVLLGVVYNRSASVRDGIAGKPLEIRLVYRQVVGGSGGDVPNSRSLEAGFRFFRGVWGS